MHGTSTTQTPTKISFFLSLTEHSTSKAHTPLRPRDSRRDGDFHQGIVVPLHRKCSALPAALFSQNLLLRRTNEQKSTIRRLDRLAYGQKSRKSEEIIRPNVIYSSGSCISYHGDQSVMNRTDCFSALFFLLFALAFFKKIKAALSFLSLSTSCIMHIFLSLQCCRNWEVKLPIIII